MIQIVCAVLDRAAGVYGRPFFVVATAQALRSFTDEVNRADAERGDMARHPGDFDLFQLGVFDDNSGVISPEVRLVTRGKDVYKGDLNV